MSLLTEGSIKNVRSRKAEHCYYEFLLLRLRFLPLSNSARFDLNSMDGCHFRFQSISHHSMSIKQRNAVEFRRHNRNLECGATATRCVFYFLHQGQQEKATRCTKWTGSKAAVRMRSTVSAVTVLIAQPKTNNATPMCSPASTRSESTTVCLTATLDPSLKSGTGVLKTESSKQQRKHRRRRLLSS